jgi:hypothetical protein
MTDEHPDSTTIRNIIEITLSITTARVVAMRITVDSLSSEAVALQPTQIKLMEQSDQP